jgi:hypothetical protein
MAFCLIKIHKANPSLLKPARIQKKQKERQTTFDWELLFEVFIACVGFAASVFIISNAIVFLYLVNGI